ncbi:MAG TPA: LacI family DNA-binding transcriptional regulator [Capsulimonadaceae bacterium]
MITISDIAEKAGVSRATVSYVLNKRSTAVRISEETRRRVVETASALGYRRNELARAVTTGNSRMLGFWVMQSQHEPVAHVLAGAMQEADSHDYFIKMLGFDNSAIGQRIVEQCVEWRLSGIIAIHAPVVALDNLQPMIAESAIPMVIVDSQGPRRGSIHVTSDQTLGVRQIIEHLASLGHRKITYVTGGSSEHEMLSHRRAEAYAAAMAAVGLEQNVNVVYGEWDADVTRAETRRMLALPTDDPMRPTAVACWSDLTAMLVIQTAAKMGVRVPDNLSVAGFDDLAGAELYNPPLTTIAQSFGEMGRIAVRRLLRCIDEESASGSPAEETLPTRLVVRASTGPSSA